MKNISFFIMLTLLYFNCIAQNNVGIGTTSPNPNAILDLESSTKGFLIPRLTTTEIGDLTINLDNTDIGLLVYDKTLNEFFYWAGVTTQWLNFRSTSTDDQTLSLVGDQLSIEDGNTITLPAGSVDTDDQTLSVVGNQLTIQDGNTVTIPDTDDQTLSLVGDQLSIADGNTITLPAGSVDTDDQTLSVVGNQLTIQDGNTVTIPDTDDQTLSLVGDQLSIADGNTITLPAGSVDTDDQTLSVVGNQLTIQDGNTVTIPDTDTDDQTLTLIGNQLSIADGNSVTLPTTTDTDDQTLSISGNTLTIQNGNSVVLPGGTDTDDQGIDILNLNGTDLEISLDDNATTSTVDLSSLAGSDADWYKLGTTTSPTSINDSIYTNRNVSIGLTTSQASLNVRNNLIIEGNGTSQINNRNGLFLGDNLTVNGSHNWTILNGNNNNFSGFSGSNLVSGNNNTLNISNGGSAFVMGDQNNISNRFGYIIGNNNSMSGSNANTPYLFGRDNTVNGSNVNDLVLIGSNHLVNGSNANGAMLIGRDHIITGSNAVGAMLIGTNCDGSARGAVCIADGGPVGTATRLNASNSYNMYMRFRGYRLYSNWDLTAGVSMSEGAGAWATISDKNKKENFVEIDKQDLLNKVASFDILNWNYLSQDDTIRHIGPFAQDFYSAFGLGTSEKSIVTSDISGVNMVAIQALYEEIEQLQSKIVLLETEKAAIEGSNSSLSERLKALELVVNKMIEFQVNK